MGPKIGQGVDNGQHLFSSVEPYSPAGHGAMVPAIGGRVIGHLAQASVSTQHKVKIKFAALVEAPRAPLQVRRIKAALLPASERYRGGHWTGRKFLPSFSWRTAGHSIAHRFFACTDYKKEVRTWPSSQVAQGDTTRFGRFKTTTELHERVSIAGLRTALDGWSAEIINRLPLGGGVPLHSHRRGDLRYPGRERAGRSSTERTSPLAAEDWLRVARA